MKQNVGPPARRSHAVAYDQKRERTVLFGGSSASTEFGDTWEWDGRFWTQVSDMGPSPRYSHAMAWDAQSARVILFGGATTRNPSSIPLLGGVSPLGDTWEWDGDRWTQLDDTGPNARFGSAIASDSARQRLVLFGGATQLQITFADTWEWDGQTWAQTEDSGPSARSRHVMAFDEASQQTLLFGGAAANGTMDPSTWAWNGTAWTQVATMGPSGRRATCLAYGHQQAVLFSGATGPPAVKDTARAADTWSWDGRFWTQRQDIGPLPRHGHAMAFDTRRQRFMLFGGEITGAVAGDTWELAERTD